MRTRIYKLFASASVDTNAAAQLIIQRNGLITSVRWCPRITSASGDVSAEIELSLASTGQQTTNDTIGPLSACAVSCDITTSGALTTVSDTHTGLAIPVLQGDRLYLNFDLTGTITIAAGCYIAVAE